MNNELLTQEKIINYSTNQHIITDKNLNVIKAGKQYCDIPEHFAVFAYFDENNIDYPHNKIEDFIHSNDKIFKFTFSKDKKTYELSISKILSAENEVENYYIEITNITTMVNNKLQLLTLTETITHDIKSSTTSEYNALKQILDERYGNISIEQKEIISEVLNSHTTLERMLDNIITGCSIDLGNFSIQLQINSYKAMIEKVSKNLKHVFVSKSQTLKIEYNSTTEKLIFDENKIYKVLLNLLTNASEHSPEGATITIKIEDENATTLKTTIFDTGDGIPKTELPLIFSKHFAIFKKFRKVGTGLGLYLSKTIIESHSGQLSLDSTPEKGTNATFSLPINKILELGNFTTQQECFQN